MPYCSFKSQHNSAPFTEAMLTSQFNFNMNLRRIFISVFILTMFLGTRPVSAQENNSEECHSPDQWFDRMKSTCRPCSTCIPKVQIQVERCTTYSDTFCFDISDFKRDRESSANRERTALSGYQATDIHSPHVTHEVEFSDVDPPEGNRPSLERSSPVLADVQHSPRTPSLAPQSAHQTTSDNNKPYEAWSVATLAMLGIIAAVVLTIAVVLVVRQIRRRSQNGGGTRKPEFKHLATRSRLFSRDRLDTNEYMHSLATLDRKMAMDEILEKRREAILASEATSGDGVNSFGDEVFVDIMGQTEEEEEAREQEARLMQKCDSR